MASAAPVRAFHFDDGANPPLCSCTKYTDRESVRELEDSFVLRSRTRTERPVSRFATWEAIERHLGIDTGRCALPGHDGYEAGVGWFKGGPQYACNCLGWRPDPDLICDHGYQPNACPFHRDRAPAWHRPLGDAYHAIWTGRELGFDDKLSRPMRAVWWLLLEHAAGIREPVGLELPVPADATDLEREAADFAALWFGLQLADGKGLPTALSVTLLADRLRVPRPRAGEALAALRRYGTIKLAGETPPRGPRRHGTFLYVPGGGPDSGRPEIVGGSNGFSSTRSEPQPARMSLVLSGR
jgi:hypothetical protein